MITKEQSKKALAKWKRFEGSGNFHADRKQMMVEKLKAEKWWNRLSSDTRSKHVSRHGTISDKRMVALYRIRNIK